MMFSLAACDGGNVPSGNNTNPPANNSTPSGNNNTPSETPSDNDPCACCPDCDQKKCECAECGDKDECECILPVGGASVQTYKVEYRIVQICKDKECPFDDCGIEISGVATADINGSAKGDGQYDHCNRHTITATKKGMLVFSTLPSFTFNAQLSLDPSNRGIIKVGFDRFGVDSETMYVRESPSETITVPGSMQLFFSNFFEDNIDSATGFFVFDVPLTSGGGAQETFTIDHEVFDFSFVITLTPVP